MKKIGVNQDNNGILRNATNQLEFINDILEKITFHYTTTIFSDNLLDINIKMSNNLNTYDINILTKNQINKSDFENFNLSMQMMGKLNGVNLNFNYFVN